MSFLRLLFFPVCLAALVPTGVAVDNRSEVGSTYSPAIGGPHGTPFDDAFIIGDNHRRISLIALYGGCDGSSWRLHRMKLQYRDNRDARGALPEVVHGRSDAWTSTSELKLATDEFVVQVEVYTYKQAVGGMFNPSHRTRIGRLIFTTNKKNKLACGILGDEDRYSKLAEGALLYFSGRAGVMIDELQAHWISPDKF